MRSLARNEQGFLSIIGLLLAVTIIGLMAYYSMTTFFKKPAVSNPEEKAMIEEQGIDTSSAQSVLDSTKVRVKDIEKVLKQREDNLINEATKNY